MDVRERGRERERYAAGSAFNAGGGRPRSDGSELLCTQDSGAGLAAEAWAAEGLIMIQLAMGNRQAVDGLEKGREGKRLSRWAIRQVRSYRMRWRLRAHEERDGTEARGRSERGKGEVRVNARWRFSLKALGARDQLVKTYALAFPAHEQLWLAI